MRVCCLLIDMVWVVGFCILGIRNMFFILWVCVVCVNVFGFIVLNLLFGLWCVGRGIIFSLSVVSELNIEG